MPVWSHDGIICTGETYKNAVKMTFARGASLKDPTGLFNAGLEGSTRRAIVFHEGDEINEQACKPSLAPPWPSTGPVGFLVSSRRTERTPLGQLFSHQEDEGRSVIALRH